MDGEKHSANAVLVWAAGLSATTAAVLLATKWWWRGERKSGGTGGTSARKPLARSSGVRVVCVQVCHVSRLDVQDSRIRRTVLLYLLPKGVMRMRSGGKALVLVAFCRSRRKDSLQPVDQISSMLSLRDS